MKSEKNWTWYLLNFYKGCICSRLYHQLLGKLLVLIYCTCAMYFSVLLGKIRRLGEETKSFLVLKL